MDSPKLLLALVFFNKGLAQCRVAGRKPPVTPMTSGYPPHTAMTRTDYTNLSLSGRPPHHYRLYFLGSMDIWRALAHMSPSNILSKKLGLLTASVCRVCWPTNTYIKSKRNHERQWKVSKAPSWQRWWCSSPPWMARCQLAIVMYCEATQEWFDALEHQCVSAMPCAHQSALPSFSERLRGNPPRQTVRCAGQGSKRVGQFKLLADDFSHVQTWPCSSERKTTIWGSLQTIYIYITPKFRQHLQPWSIIWSKTLSSRGLFEHNSRLFKFCTTLTGKIHVSKQFVLFRSHVFMITWQVAPSQW